MIKKSYEEVMERAGPDMFTPRTAKDNKAAMDLREQLSLKESQIQHSHGCNESKNAVIVKIEAEDYVFPRNSHFYCHDVRDLASKKVRMDKKFDLVLMDPPWWNKSVRRRKKSSSDGWNTFLCPPLVPLVRLVRSRYDMMYNQEVVDIPVRDLLKPDGVVAVWCTTSSSCLDSILNEMFPAWGVVFRAKWYWIKVCRCSWIRNCSFHAGFICCRWRNQDRLCTISMKMMENSLTSCWSLDAGPVRGLLRIGKSFWAFLVRFTLTSHLLLVMTILISWKRFCRHFMEFVRKYFLF